MTNNSRSNESNCGPCRAMGNRGQCPGHAGGSGGASGGGGQESSGSNENQNSYSHTNHSNVSHNFINDELMNNLLENEFLENRTINYEAGMLTIESNRLLGNLIFRTNPGVDQYDHNACQELFKLIQHQFNEFKSMLNENRVSITNFTATLKDNQLSIHIPNPEYFDKFVKLLAQANLLSLPSEKQSLTNERSSYSLPNPFDISKGPRPKGWKEETN